ncbi:MAG TPA: M20 family peptidase [Myxococcota bacterium]|nr:M20 family peptidase [Myxococcota bacterium]
MKKKFALGLVLALAALAGVVVVRGALLASKQLPDSAVPAPAPAAVDGAAAALHLAGALHFRTISSQDPAAPGAAEARTELEGLHAYLAATYPRAHAALAREVVGGGSLLFTWKGSDATLPPVLLMAHLDVVPVEPGTEGAWKHPPFAGVIADGFVWGRGALDDKGSLVAMLEAVETLLAAGFAPKRTFYFAFGHDEEVGGGAGNAKMAALLAERGVHLAWVLDEGLAILDGIVEGVSKPVALVGLAEKGYVTVELTVTGEGGHSSMPPRHTPVGILGAAVARLEEHPLPASIEGPARAMFDWLAPEMSFSRRVAFANLWLLGPLVEQLLAARPATDALIRTTTAPTMIEGSVKENVLPAKARALVNFRVRPGDSVAAVLDHVRACVDDDRVAVKAISEFASEPSPVSSADGAGFALVHRTIREVFPRVLVAPGLVTGATDSRYYAGLADGVYRFFPLWLGPDDRARFHGTDERVPVDHYADAVRFYAQLLRNASL